MVNITSIVNTSKLYSIGGKLNIYLKEINNLWNYEIKNRKMNFEYQNIVILYSRFLSEILWDRKKSQEISNKLKDDNLNNYHLNDYKKDEEEKNMNINILEYLLDNQDYLLFCSSDEKGNCKIIQISTSLSQFLGYQKSDIISKSLEIIFPNIVIEEQLNYFEKYFKLISRGPLK